MGTNGAGEAVPPGAAPPRAPSKALEAAQSLLRKLSPSQASALLASATATRGDIEQDGTFEQPSAVRRFTTMNALIDRGALEIASSEVREISERVRGGFGRIARTRVRPLATVRYRLTRLGRNAAKVLRRRIERRRG